MINNNATFDSKQHYTMGNSNSSGGGIGFAGLLTICFIVLKLTHFIGWSWLWVLSPAWIPVAVAVVLIIISGTIK